MPLDRETNHGGVTVVSHGAPDPALMRKAVEAMFKAEIREEKRDAA